MSIRLLVISVLLSASLAYADNPDTTATWQGGTGWDNTGAATLILVGQGDYFAEVTLSGDCTMSVTGAITCSASGGDTNAKTLCTDGRVLFGEDVTKCAVVNTCAGTDKITYNGTDFVCGSDIDTDTNAKTLCADGQVLLGEDSSTCASLTTCASGNYSRFNGTDFVCAADTGTFAGTTGGTDNALLRANGTGGTIIQAAACTVDDSGNLDCDGTLTASCTPASSDCGMITDDNTSDHAAPGASKGVWYSRAGNAYVRFGAAGAAEQVCTSADITSCSAASAEVNDLETTDPPNVAADEIYIGTGVGAGAWATLSGDITNSLGVTSIGADKILESMLKAVDAAVDEECLTYEVTTGDFEWQTCAGAEVNNLELADPPNVLATEVYIGTGAGAGAWAPLSGNATMTSGGVVTVSDLTCTNCIGDTEITTHAGTSLAADLEEETHASEHASGGGDAVDHDTLTNFVADEHVAHTGVTLTAGAGLSGGGDISANRSFATASGEANFLADGGVTSLTCGVSNQGKAQVMDDGSIEYCDGAATSVLRQGFLDADGVDADTIFSPNADPGVDHSGYVAGGPGTDNTAIHDDTASEISTITLKATPVSADMLLIEDSAATNAKKRITIGSLPASAEVNDLTAAVTWANVPDANVSGINERDEVCGTTDLDATCNINTAVIGRTQIDETLLSIQTHATDCTLLTCDASSDGEQCFQQSTNAVYTCDGSGTPAWTTPAVGGSQNLFETINASSGTDPVADSATDTLALTGTAPIVATGASATDTVTFSLTQNAGTDVTADLEEETHASEHSLGGTDAITATNLASACTDAQVLGGTSAGTGVECQTGNDDDVYNIVTDYSAACDGATDDTTEIQAAIDAANTAGGGIVYVPEGTCVLLTVVNLKSNVVLRGEGPSSILKLSSSAAVNTNMLAMTTGITNVVIEDLSLDGNAANQLNTDGAAIKLDHTTTALDNIVIRRVNFHDHDQYGIRTVGNTSVTRLKIINNVFKDMGSGAGSGAHTIHMNQAAPGVIISRNHIDTVGATGNCIWVGNQSDNALIADNYCKSPAAMGIEFWTNTIGQAAIRGNVIDSPGTFGISLALSPNSSVAGNVVNSPTSLGIEVARSDHSTVSANIVKNSGTSGITVDQSSYVTVSNNTVESGGDANPESGIDLVNGANAALSYNNVVGNTIKMKALSAVRGVNLRCDNTTKVCKGNLIANNIITGDATTSQRAINTERDGAAAATCSDTMIVDNHLENVDVGVRNGCTNSIIANNDFVTVTTKRQTITSGTQKILELACDGTKCDLDIDDDGVAEYSFDAGGLSASEAPGTVVTAGDALTLTGSDIDFDGGAAPAGELGGTWASPTVDAIHSGSAHHSAVTVSGTPDYITLSGQDIVRGTVDISDDTNLTAGDGITLTLDDLDWDGIEVDSNGTPQGNLLGIDFGNLFSLTKENGCVGGTEPGSSCTTNTDCAGSGTCTASSQHAVGLSAQVYVQGDTIQTADLPAVVKNRFVTFGHDGKTGGAWRYIKPGEFRESVPTRATNSGTPVPSAITITSLCCRVDTTPGTTDNWIADPVYTNDCTVASPTWTNVTSMRANIGSTSKWDCTTGSQAISANGCWEFRIANNGGGLADNPSCTATYTVD